MSDPVEAPSALLNVQSFPPDDAIVVRCSGKLIFGQSGTLYTEVKRLIPTTNRIILDLTDVTRMDSLGLGTVVSLYVSAKAAGCDLKLINLGKRVRELFVVANLESLFDLYGDHPG
jgi:anti-sigma B factor antagonist